MRGAEKPSLDQPTLAPDARVRGVLRGCAARLARRATFDCAARDLSRRAGERILQHSLTAEDFMNTFRLSVLALSMALVGAAAHAEGKTREQVRAELMEAKAAGLVTYGEQQYPVDLPHVSTKTRQQVREELDAARAAGLVTYGEQDYPPALPSQLDKTRDQTVAELREARLRGQMKSGELDYPPAVN
jgi:predicted RNase H-like HicB family nuclease